MGDTVNARNTALRIILPLNLTPNLRASEMKTNTVNPHVYNR